MKGKHTRANKKPWRRGRLRTRCPYCKGPLDLYSILYDRNGKTTFSEGTTVSCPKCKVHWLRTGEQVTERTGKLPNRLVPEGCLLVVGEQEAGSNQDNPAEKDGRSLRP